MKRWRVMVEGASDGQPFMQNILVLARNQPTAEDLALQAFDKGGDSLIGIVEVEPLGTKFAIWARVEAVQGRIFFGPKA